MLVGVGALLGSLEDIFGQLGEEFCQCHIALDVQIEYVILDSIWLLFVEDGMNSLCSGSLEEELNQPAAVDF